VGDIMMVFKKNILSFKQIKILKYILGFLILGLVYGCMGIGEPHHFDLNRYQPKITTANKIPLKVLVKTLEPPKFINWSTSGGLQYHFHFKQNDVIALSRVFDEVIPVDNNDNNLNADLYIEVEHLINHDTWSQDTSTAHTNMTIFDSQSLKAIDNIDFSLNYYKGYREKRDRSLPPLTFVDAAMNDIYSHILKKMQISKTLYIKATKQINTDNCLTEKDKLSEEYVHYKYKTHSSNCDKVSDELSIVESMLGMYKKCPDLDKGTGKRAKFLDRSYKLEQLKQKYCKK
jgi:hypothetical protein